MPVINLIKEKWRSLPESWRYCIPIFLGMRILVTITGIAIWGFHLTPAEAPEYVYHGVEPILDGLPGALVGIWQRWDSLNYLRVFQHGYSNDYLSLFFPLYILLGKFISLITSFSAEVSFLLVSNLAFLIALVEMFKLGEEIFDRQKAKKIVLYTAIFPTAFFHFAIYPQSLVLLLIVTTIRAAIKRQWITVFVLGLFSGLAHLTAITLPVILFFYALRDNQSTSVKTRLARLISVFSPAISLSAFLGWRHLSGFDSYLTQQAVKGGRWMITPWSFFENLLDPAYISTHFKTVLGAFDLILLLIFALSALWAFRNLSTGWGLYHISAMILFVITSNQADPMACINRYALSMPVIFFWLAEAMDNYAGRIIKFTLSLFFYVFFTSMFFMWIWVG